MYKIAYKVQGSQLCSMKNAAIWTMQGIQSSSQDYAMYKLSGCRGQDYVTAQLVYYNSQECLLVVRVHPYIGCQCSVCSLTLEVSALSYTGGQGSVCPLMLVINSVFPYIGGQCVILHWWSVPRFRSNQQQEIPCVGEQMGSKWAGRLTVTDWQWVPGSNFSGSAYCSW